jgi:tetratricopeptide (TPR) repeat protein
MPKTLGVLVGLLLAATTPITAQSSVAQLADAGWQAIQHNDADRAAALFGEALTMRPNDAVLNLGAGVAAHLQGHEENASHRLRHALELDAALTPASALLGEIAYHEGHLDLAIKTYEAALVHSPGNPALTTRLEAWRTESAGYDRFETVKDDRFAVMFEGPVEQKLATRAIAVLGAAFWRIGKEIGAYPNAPINVILYTDKQFRDVTGAPEWAGGGFDGQIRMPVRGAQQNMAEFDRVVTHELTHAMLHAVAARNLPAWLNEGLAMYFEGGDADAAAVEQTLANARVYVPLSVLQASFSRLNASQASVAYAESLVAVAALMRRIGAPGLAQLLQDLDAGADVTSAVQRFGFTLADFETTLARRAGVTLPTARR